MTRAVIIIAALVVATLVAVAAVLLATLGHRRIGRGLRRRFGPEYERLVSRHEGDTKAADRELGARLKQHGSVRERPLSPASREQYAAQWAGIQKRFVDSPQEAVAEADALLARLTADRGFPDGGPFEERLAALSVHHAQHVDGYRGVHGAVRGPGGTEEKRLAMIGARDLFDALVAQQPADSGRHRPQRHHAEGSGTR
ncbi:MULTISPECIES: hypothetical protein [unclassified Streptomyces]|uniref:hypothetical protein n=1 Tax=unclassified Streptomyces TaxID=2593676 RepID=UPI000DC7C664|nr:MULTISPECIES: hypothetical protein [unclassified Streptomyces]AWZ03341.1 hypothetical protein DRB89_00330 [Streptomyces sp. ICC4]AWZ11119.1 hypothetical protein DRB96_00840 [Streptomyces sp. ICC1]